VFCADVGVFCQDWARKGECDANPSYMNQNCAKTCGRCIASKDNLPVMEPKHHTLDQANVDMQREALKLPESDMEVHAAAA